MADNAISEDVISSQESDKGRRNGGSEQLSNSSVTNVKTRSGRTVKPSAILREMSQDSSSTVSETPVKRKAKIPKAKAKRTKFVFQTSSEETGNSSQGESSQNSRFESGASQPEVREVQYSGDNIGDTQEISPASGELLSDKSGGSSRNNNAAVLEGESARTKTAKRVKSVVKRVQDAEDVCELESEMDKSINFVMTNETAFERIMKNCMPAFLRMTQEAAQEPKSTPGSAGESFPVNLSLTENLTGLSLGDEVGQSTGIIEADVVNHGNHVNQPKGNESEITLYRRGCTKEGEENTLRQLPIIQGIQNVQNELNRLSQGIVQEQMTANVTMEVSDSDNVTSDESTLMTSSDDFETGNLSKSDSGNNGVGSMYIVGKGRQPGSRRVVEVPTTSRMRVVSAAAGRPDTEVPHTSVQRDHPELQKLQAEERAKEIVRQAANVNH